MVANKHNALIWEHYLFLNWTILAHITLKEKVWKKNLNTRATVCFDRELKKEAEKIFSAYGVNLQTGVNILLKLLVDEKIQIFK